MKSRKLFLWVLLILGVVSMAVMGINEYKSYTFFERLHVQNAGDSGEDAPLPDRFYIGVKPYSKVRKNWSWYNRPYDLAIAKFPTFSACGFKNERTGEFELFWKKIKSLKEAEICLFLLAEQLKTADALGKWFKRNGFETVFVSDPTNIAPGHNGWAVGVTFKLGSPSIPFSFGPATWFARAMGRGVSVGVGYDKKGKVRTSNLTINWE